MITLREIKDSLLHLLFPHICTGCGSDQLPNESNICMRCMERMPQTEFDLHAGNPVEKMFMGRLPLTAATAQFYFTKASLIQHLMHRLKYKGDKELGLQLGSIMGRQIAASGRFAVDGLIPLPLFPARERKRGYNQATILCQGMASWLKVPVMDRIIFRPYHTETQTKKGRVERWKNIQGKFFLRDAEAIRGKHLLLVDDVVTTGATLESCGALLLKEENVRLSIATLCLASH